jgi:hypothetical protein
VVVQWTEGDEAVGFAITSACLDHAHWELVGVDKTAVAGGTITRTDCLTLARMLIKTAEWIDSTNDDYVTAGSLELEQYANGHV